LNRKHQGKTEKIEDYKEERVKKKIKIESTKTRYGEISICLETEKESQIEKSHH